MGELIDEITDHVTRTWVLGKPILVRKMMQTISMRVILRAVFGCKEFALSADGGASSSLRVPCVQCGAV